MFAPLTIRKSTFLGSLVIIIMLTGTLGAFWIHAVYRNYENQGLELQEKILTSRKQLMVNKVQETVDTITFKKKQTEENNRNRLRQRVLEGYGLAMDIFRENRDTKTLAEIKRMVIERLRKVRFDNGRGYYFATTGVGAPELIADRPELTGTMTSGTFDTTRETRVRSMIGFDVAKEEAFYAYQARKPTQPGSDFSKLSFVKFFEPFRWYLGTGIYLDDAQREIQKEVLDQEESRKTSGKQTLTIFGINGSVLLHREAHHIGRNILLETDADGQEIFHKIQEDCLKHRTGFFTFSESGRGNEKKVPKIAYAALYPDWDWIIMSEMAIDDISNIIQEKQSELGQQVRKTLLFIGFVFLGVLIPVLLFSRYFSKKLSNEFRVFSLFFKNAVATRKAIDRKDCTFLEFQEIADLANEMITEQKTVEEELKNHRDHLEALVGERTRELLIAKDLAESASRAKSEFLAHMSHELRTPLNAILGYAQILLREKNLTENQKNQLATIQNSGDHLLTLISEILDLSRIEAQKIEVEMNPFNLPDLIQNVLSTTRLKAETKKLSVFYEEETLLPEWVKGDNQKVQQVLLNLMDNAIKFTDKGRITLRISSSELAVSNGGPLPGPRLSYFRFQVEDTGLGIPPEKNGEIFEPFMHGEFPGRTIEGIGLGLAISRRLTELMGGRLTFESQAGKGSTFILELDLEVVTEGPAPVREPRTTFTGYQGERKQLLLVDDSLTNLALLRSLLEPLGFEVETAEDGSRAIEKISQDKPDLILLDLLMPGLGGDEVLRQIRNQEQGASIKVIGISAAVADKERVEAFAGACDDFIPKPIKTEVLLLKIKEQLGITWREEAGETVSRIEKKSPSTPAEPERERMPSRAVLEEIIREAEEGEFSKIERILDALEMEEGMYRPFCIRLRAYVRRYDDESIIRIIKTRENGHGNQ